MKWEVLKLLGLKYALTLHFAFELVVVWKSLCSLVRWESGKANSQNDNTLKIYLKENE